MRIVSIRDSNTFLESGLIQEHEQGSLYENSYWFFTCTLLTNGIP
jgi:hypothetical protein